jgi:enamine deaminase RidA (YjgF/YER057c/UK114 family)
MAIAKLLRLLPLMFAAGASSAAAAPVTPINPSYLWDMSSLGWSQISLAEPGRLAFISGQVAGSPVGDKIPSDLTSQSRIVAANIKKSDSTS